MATLKTLTNSNEYINVNYDGYLRIVDHAAGNWINFHGVYICQ